MPSPALTFALVASTAVSLVQASPTTPSSFGPSTAVAAQRGNAIFNSVFDSLRKYGSTVHPNGMSLYLATVPQGVLFHHGNGRNETPTALDWLAYEIEHAEMFARTKMGPPGGRGPAEGPGGGPGDEHDPRPGPPGPPGSFGGPLGEHAHFDTELAPQFALGGRHAKTTDTADEPSEDDAHGWLHIYRTTRPLQFLYIDGMSGDKGNDGVIDTQDYLLRASDAGAAAAATKTTVSPAQATRPPGPPGEFARAEDLCELCAAWDLQGVIRTEGAGTEIIKCDFFDGLEEVQSLQRSDSQKGGFHGGPGGRPGGGGHGGPGGHRPGGPGGPGGPRTPSGPFNPENSFRDVGGHRTVLDYASMVSAFFFPVNLTNPDKGRAEFPRLVGASTDELVAIKSHLAGVVAARRNIPLAPYSWRDVADLIVRRYASRLTSLANATTAANMESELQSVLNVFLDYSVADAAQREAEAEARCTAFYLQTKTPLETEGDRLIYAAFEAVTGEICGTLLDALKTVSTEASGASAVEAATASIKELIAYLDWSVFEK